MENSQREKEAWAEAARAFGKYSESRGESAGRWRADEAWAAATAALIAYEKSLRESAPGQ